VVPAPTGLKTTSIQSNAVSLSWTAASNAAGYVVQRATQAGGPYTAVNAKPVTTTSYKDTSVAASTTYFYVVAAVNKAGASSKPSNEVTATTPAAPACFETNNYQQVVDGRAHTELGLVYANGSNNFAGLFNIFSISTLKQTGPNYYVVGTCTP
jgi:hypothetical protein